MGHVSPCTIHTRRTETRLFHVWTESLPRPSPLSNGEEQAATATRLVPSTLHGFLGQKPFSAPLSDGRDNAEKVWGFIALCIRSFEGLVLPPASGGFGKILGFLVFESFLRRD
ncbi:hypothetical protein ACLOJK_012899 [Asimina triloba]